MPASASGIRAGRAYVEIGGDNAPFFKAIRAVEKRLRTLGATFKAAGRQMVATSAALAAPLVAGTAVFASFEQRMARVKALTGANAQQMAALNAEAQRLGRETVFSASQAGEAMSFFALAGFKVDQILTAIGPTLKLAAAGEMGVAQAADIAAKIMAGMGLSADQLGNTVDVLTMAMTTANTDLVQLGDAMKFVGPIAKTARVPLEEIVAAIQGLSNAGIQAEMAGTTLRGMLLSLTSPSAEAAGKLKELGVAVNDAEGNVRPLADILDDLNIGLAGMGSGERLGALGQIFDARQAAGAAELLSQGGAKLREATAALHNAAGTADRISKTQLDTLRGDLTILASAAEGAGISIGEVLVAPLRATVQWVTRVVGALSEWIKTHKQVVLVIAGTVAAIGGLGVALIGTGIALKVMAGALGLVGGALRAVRAVSMLVIAPMKTFALLKVAIAALASPLGIATLALGALGAAFIASRGEGDTFLQRLGSGFQKTFGGAIEVVRDVIDLLIAGELGAAADVALAGLRSAFANAMQPITEVWRGIVGGLATVWVDGLASLKTAWSDFTTWMYTHFPETTSTIAKIWARFVAALRGGWEQYLHWATIAELKLAGADEETLQLAWEEHRARQAGIRADRATALGEADRFATLSPEQLEAENKKTKAEIEAARRAALAEIDATTAEMVAKADEAKKKAAAALVAARDRSDTTRLERLLDAAQREGQAEWEAYQRTLPPPAADAMARATRNAAAAGKLRIDSSAPTFQANVAKLIGGTGGIDRVIQEQQKTNAALRDIDRHIQDGGAEFE